MRRLIGKFVEFTRMRPKLSIALIIAFIAIFTVVNVEAIRYTSKPNFCAMCHPGVGPGPLSQVYTWRQNIHSEAGVSCLDCHADPGFVGYMRAKTVSGFKDVFSEIFRSEEHKLAVLSRSIDNPSYSAQLVPSTRCLFCHSDSVNQQIRGETLMSVGIDFRLKDQVINPEFRLARGMSDILTDEVAGDINPHHFKHHQAGISCADCHSRAVHGGPDYFKVDRNRCFECHTQRKNEIKISEISFGEGPSAAVFSHEFHGMMFSCTDCHTDLFPLRAGESKITFVDHFNQKTCFSCHNGKKASFNCISCHAQPPTPSM